jgi:hypothetical protein
MGVKDILKLHQIEFDPKELDTRMELLLAGLRRDPEYPMLLEAFKSQRGGQVPGQVSVQEDFLGPRVIQFMDAITSPYARVMIRSVFLVIFFMSYLEKIPVFGSVLSAALDIMLAGGKMITKTIQKTLPPAVGLLPLPYASMVGMGAAAVFGMIVWPLIAAVSFSRQDFAAAIDAFFRVVPPPFGDMIADVFMDANRMAGRLDAKRQKLGEDIATAVRTLGDAMSVFKEQANTFADQTQAAASLPSKVGGKRHGFSRKTSRHKKWKTRRQRK